MNQSGVVVGLGDCLINVDETLVFDEVFASNTSVLRSSVTELLWALRRFSFGALLPSLVSTYISRLLSQLSLQIYRGPLRGRGPFGVALTLTIVRYANGVTGV